MTASRAVQRHSTLPQENPWRALHVLYICLDWIHVHVHVHVRVHVRSTCMYQTKIITCLCTQMLVDFTGEAARGKGFWITTHTCRNGKSM